MKKILNILMGIIIIFSFSIIILNLVGYKSYRVISDSMSPKIYKNALAFVSTNTNQKLEAGTIIAYAVDDKLVLHRIFKIDGDNIITKGDANNVVDSPIDINSVIGVYKFSIPLIGILFASVYPWIIIILVWILYLVIAQMVIEIKKKN